jgi:hypothetical protein
MLATEHTPGFHPALVTPETQAEGGGAASAFEKLQIKIITEIFMNFPTIIKTS